MRTSMAMVAGSCRKKSGLGARRREWCVERAEEAFLASCAGRTPRLTAVRRQGSASTDGAGKPAQIDVQPRHEQCARRLLAHVVENHGLIVSIPGGGPGV
ncbi:hypothetical protein GCM10023083_03850 [Streptomyces phyllanthi]